jgi:hypothetical protein
LLSRQKILRRAKASELALDDRLLLLLDHVTIEQYFNKLVGRRDIEDALARLGKLTQDEVRMVAAQVLKTAHGVDDKVQGVSTQVQAVDERVNTVHDSAHVVFDILWTPYLHFPQ